MYGYLRKFASSAIQVKVLDPDFNLLPEQELDWCHGVYGKIEELLGTDAPKPFGNALTMVTYTDANFYHSVSWLLCNWNITIM
jgi:hypothetical protein